MFKALIFNITSDRGSVARLPGPYRIATELRRNNWDVEVVDHTTRWEIEELYHFCNTRITKDTKFVGFSRLFHDHKNDIHLLAAYIKQKWPHVMTIIGSSIYNNINDQNIDYYICGYGEKALLELLKWKFSNGKMPPVQITDGNSVIFADKSCASAPWPDPSIIYEDRDFIMPYEWLSVEFSRGCKFQCSFCDFPFIGVKGDYTRDSRNFELQLRDAYDRFGVTNYTCSDDTFNDSTGKVKKYADVVDQLDFSPSFVGYIRPDLLISRPADREELVKMNFFGHFYGVESFNTASARSIRKGMDSDRMKQGLIDVKDYFKTHGAGRYRGTVSMIAGLPHETLDSLYKSKAWLEENWEGEGVIFFPYALNPKDNIKKSLISQDPGSYGYTMMTEEEVSKYDIKIDKHHTSNLNWKTEHMNRCEARLFVDEFERIHHDYFRIGTFELSCLNKSRDLDQVIKQYITEDYIAEQRKEEQEHVEEYIRKKINNR
jgi:radical SAM superfamily enzyme YgiQ (UPF0313 family)